MTSTHQTPVCRLDAAPGSPSPHWSFPPSPPQLILRCDNITRPTTLQTPTGEIIQTWTDPLQSLAWMASSIRHHPRARWLGYLSYDLGRCFEQFNSPLPDDLHLPLFAFCLQSADNPTPAPPSPPPDFPPAPFPLQSTFTRQSYLRAVERAIDYIRAGDLYQVNLSQRFTAPLTAPPIAIYHRLLQQSPAWYGAYLDFGDHALLSNSPELFFSITPQGRITTRPIKGTRPLLPGMEQELRDSIKDQAELNMIVDLQRNDLGRICQIGSVHVTQPRLIESHPTIYHAVAAIQGQLRPEITFVDLLRAMFPGGSITGAPKIRAMQIIDQLEPVRRGPYCGAIGYLASDGSIEFNIAIRTIITRAGFAHIPVGGGIVADSNPAGEYEETLVKSRAMLRALGIKESTARRATPQR